MARKNYEVAFQFGATLNSNMKKALSSAGNMVGALNSQITGLGKGQGQITAFKTLQESIKKNVVAMRAMEAGSKRDKLTERIRQQQKSLVSLRSVLKGAGVDMKNLSGVEEKLAAAAERTKKAHEAMQKVLERGAAIKQQRNEFRTQMIDAYALTKTLAAPIKQAMKFESAMADVKKVVDFDTPQQFKDMSNAILEMGRRIPMTHEGLAAIVAAGGQAGFAREELLVFAEDAAKMGTAFDISADEAGQAMAGWRSAFKYNQDQVRTLSDQINYLGNTTAASAPKISAVVTRIGALGDVAGLKSSQVAALGATLTGMNIGPEIAATGIKKLMLVMNAGGAATKKQTNAFAKLGINTKKLARAMQKDGEKTILTVLERISKLDATEQTSLLKELFGEEAVASIAPLLTGLDTLKNNFDKVSDSAKYAGSSQKEFEARSATTENTLQLFKNSVSEMGTALGDTLLPPLNDTVKAVSPFLQQAAEWVKQNPEVAGGITKIVAGLMALKVATIGFRYASTFVTGPLNAMHKNFLMYRSAGTLTRNIGMMNGALQRTHPALRAVSGGIGDVRSANGGKAFRIIGQGADTMRQSIGPAPFASAVSGVDAVRRANGGGVFRRIGRGIGFMAGALGVTPLGAVITALTVIVANWETIVGWMDKATAAMKNFHNEAEKSLGISVDPKVKEAVDVPRSKGGSHKDGTLQHYARGGVVTRPTFALIGEGGSDESVIPHDGSKRALGLWAQAGEALGVSPETSGYQAIGRWARAGEGLGSQKGDNGETPSDTHLTFAPVFRNYFSGQADTETVSKAMELSERRLRQMLDNVIRNNARVALV